MRSSRLKILLVAAVAAGVVLWWNAGPSEQSAEMAARQDLALEVAIAPPPAAVLPPVTGAAPEPPKPPLLAREQAEAERHAALREKREEAPPRLQLKQETKLYYKVQVRDGGTLAAGGAVIRLAGIKAREADETCKDERGRSWACGAASRLALVRLIRARAVTCTLPLSGEQKEFAASCSVGGTELSTWMVRHGWAEPDGAAEGAMAEAAKAARQERIGLWRAAD